MNEYIVEFAKFWNGININDYIDRQCDIAYHYTSPGGFNGIIENCSMRFTDRFYLNDKSEGIYVLQLCLDNIDSFDNIGENFKNSFLKKLEERLLKPQRDNFYVYQCSLSNDGDNLCLWNYYTKNDGIKGYNIGLNVTKLEEGFKPIPCTEGRIPKLYWGNVMYDKLHQIEQIKKLVSLFYEFSKKYTNGYDDFTTAYLVDKIMLLGIFFKAKYFEAEKEFRLAFNLYLDDRGNYAVIKNKPQFYNKNGVFVPYVDIEFVPDLLSEIVISPTMEYKSAQDSVYRMIRNKYPHIKIDAINRSKIPVRY